MSPRDFQSDTIRKRLVSLRRILGELEKYRDSDAKELRSDLSQMYAVFFMLQQVIDLATDINQHIAATTLNVADSSSRRGFEDLIRAGVLPADLEQDFYKSLALRNVITHHYVEVDLGIVSNSIPRVLDVYTQYVKSISRWLASR
ncbi:MULTISPECIES: type VII toxin-antitoxin system HepT family RNase toxin [unclassified Corynebacterium]|uniref:type VII toxin-antitoxin system HepT family RNase toxin n=1 Tax=Corynebacterium TaxID=1716 RepID=UPI00254D8CB6|nr:MULTISPECIES: DUF86 domain-containing protein [unclassified Corynebacterium]MDK8451847.1 DUF86 domain-containing protein [Corynebacterium sp. MSK084]MDK8490781.1 DUF86 domain-containing protein [Corynebacterium sp. MSK175]MDK8513783.1 DUF86 domain-containing protein [Corynebacterium sp. MSK123]MDK8546841.1 DUF86 domain-containing protein [Corynebacterium sp. MSK222]MDK8647067.1 DUF86 domain-containing protein [Corynebacterium sp. MSK082]